MECFTASEIDEIDHLWRRLPIDHMWTGWATAGEAPELVWIFRTRAHWRRFPLTKTAKGYVLADEGGRRVFRAVTLADLLQAVEAVPGLNAMAQD